MLDKPLKSLPDAVTGEDPTLDIVQVMERRTSQYIELRDTIARIKQEQEEQLKPYLEAKDMAGAEIQKFMNDNGLKNLKTAAGTCYTSDHYTASVADGEAFMSLVKEGNWSLIERRANSTAVKDWVQEHKALPAGVNLNVEQRLGVRRPK